MAASLINGGRVSWGGQRDADKHRTWTLRNLVRTSDPLDGPQVVLACAGLPTVGSTYGFGNDADEWAYCHPDAKVAMVESKNDNTFTWAVDQIFSTRPLGNQCNTNPITDPILEPMRIGGSFVRFSRAAVRDRFGLAIVSSSWELFRGREVEFDDAYPTVWIEQNTRTLGLSTFSQYINAVNENPMWGLAARCVKLSNVVWERKAFATCSFYYTRRFEFDIRYETFDRYIQDEGTKVLNGHHGAPGSGCTIDVSTVDKNGAILTAAINSGGTGYPINTTTTLALNDSVGDGASVTVQTNGSGVVTSIVVVSNGGYGYIASTSAVPTIGSGWVLDDINGQEPNRFNPQHFIRYKDRTGECARVVLDGRGQPAIGKYPGQRLVQKYPSMNLFVLGVPASL